MKIHHIGYLVKKIDRAAEEFERLGYVQEKAKVYDPVREIHICFLIKDGYRVELVSPASSDSIVSGLIKTYKNAPYHICYESESFDGDLARLESSGYLKIDEPLAAPAIEGKEVVFLMNPSIGMIEIINTA